MLGLCCPADSLFPGEGKHFVPFPLDWQSTKFPCCSLCITSLVCLDLVYEELLQSQWGENPLAAVHRGKMEMTMRECAQSCVFPLGLQVGRRRLGFQSRALGMGGPATHSLGRGKGKEHQKKMMGRKNCFSSILCNLFCCHTRLSFSSLPFQHV